MKKMTMEEFQDRVDAISRANRIFIDSGMTSSITEAFILYQGVFAEREREIMISTLTMPRNPSFMDKYERPKCPECGFDVLFQIIPENADGIHTRLQCSNSQCDSAWDSEKTIEEWMKQLKAKTEE